MDEIEVLVHRAKQNDQEAFARLYEMHYQAMYHYALHVCQNNYADAQEAVQDAFLSAFEHLDQLQKPAYFPLWIKRIVHSKCIRLFHKHKDISVDPEEIKTNAVEEQRVDFLPHQSLENATDQQILHALVQELTEKQQQIIYYFYFQQCSINEISQALHISKGTVKSRIFEARRNLKKKIKIYEAREKRKINFHLQPVLPSFCYLCASQLSNLKIFQSNIFIQSTTFIATASCAVFTVQAVTSTYQTITQVNTPSYASSAPLQEKKIEELEYVEFPTLYFKEKNITTPRAAYYTLMKIAPDKESLEALSKEEKESLQPLVQAIQYSNTNYKDALKKAGWF